MEERGLKGRERGGDWEKERGVGEGMGERWWVHVIHSSSA